MKTVFGLLLIIAGVCFGLYVGVWVMFIGGIIDIITQIRAEHMEALTVSFGVLKIIFSSLVGYLAGVVAVLPGIAILGKD